MKPTRERQADVGKATVATGENAMGSSTGAGQLDVAQLNATELPASSFPGGQNQPFRVYFSSELHAKLWQHAQESQAVEICGVLVGAWGRDERGPFVSITESIRGEAAASKFAEVTFTHETWAKINQEMDSRLAHLAIVGWYHSHPDFGIFLSDRDVFIQQHFFANPGHVALVIDPVRKTEGTFVWKRGKPALVPHYWVGDQVQLAGAISCRGAPAEPSLGPTAPEQEKDAPVPDAPAGPLFGTVTQVLAYAALFLAGFLLGGRWSDVERGRVEQDAVARASLLLGVKPGLREALDGCLADMGAMARDADTLAREHEKAAGEAMTEAERGKWNEVRSGLAKARSRLAELQARYCLTAGETQRTLQLTAILLANQTPGLSARQRDQLARQLEGILQQGAQKGLFELPTKPSSEPPPKPADGAPAGEDGKGQPK